MANYLLVCTARKATMVHCRHQGSFSTWWYRLLSILLCSPAASQWLSHDYGSSVAPPPGAIFIINYNRLSNIIITSSGLRDLWGYDYKTQRFSSISLIMCYDSSIIFIAYASRKFPGVLVACTSPFRNQFSMQFVINAMIPAAYTCNDIVMYLAAGGFSLVLLVLV